MAIALSNNNKILGDWSFPRKQIQSTGAIQTLDRHFHLFFYRIVIEILKGGWDRVSLLQSKSFIQVSSVD